MAKIDEYKLRLGYGARENFFKVEMVLPDAVSSAYNLTSKNNNDILDILLESVNFPKPRDPGKTTIEYWGEFYKYVSERADYDKTLSFKFKNTEDFYLRNMFTYWMNLIQRPYQGNFAGATGKRLNPEDYKTKSFNLFILDKELSEIRQLVGYGLFPVDISELSLGYEGGKGNITETTVTMSIDYYDVLAGKGKTGRSSLTNLVD